MWPEEERNRVSRAGGRPQAARQPELGVGLARQPPDDVQPRQRRPGGQALERAQELRLVGRGPQEQVDRHRRARLRAGQGARATAPSPTATGMAAIAGDSPFIMHADGKGWLFAPGGIKDGPLPTHYEPVESPLDKSALQAAGQPHGEGGSSRR